MQFKHPELLYALLLLLIPIIVHLFQLRRFKKQEFTNVAFLKEVVIKTRKSSQIKKWLALLSRLLAIACLVLAFAQPFYAKKQADQPKDHLVIYLDNSFSMQATGPKGPLLQHSIQELFSKLNVTSEFDWFTNDQDFANSTLDDFKREVLAISTTQSQLSLDQVVLKAQTLAGNAAQGRLRLLMVSDFQRTSALSATNADNLSLEAVFLQPTNRNNISLDSVYLEVSGSQRKLFVQATADRTQETNYPVSLLNKGQLVTKSSFDFSESRQSELTFELNSEERYQGQLLLNDEQLSLDNQLYFSLEAPEIIKVLSVSQEDDQYIKRLFSGAEFDLSAFSLDNLNYSQILDQNLLILNGINTITPALTGALTPFLENGGHVIVVPGINSDIESYNGLISTLGMGRWNALEQQERKISNIAFEHPVYREVFDKEVSNFEYPVVKSFFTISSPVAPALRLDGNAPFLIQNGAITIFTASLSAENSNFVNSPLIVPTFYNTAINSLPSPPLYYTIGRENQFAVSAQLNSDQVLRLRNQEEFIPLQQRFANMVRVNTSDEPSTAATYAVMAQNDTLRQVSFNYNRAENSNQYLSQNQLDGIEIYDTVQSAMIQLQEDNSVTAYWKWFLIFAVLFLLVEMALLKFLK